MVKGTLGCIMRKYVGLIFLLIGTVSVYGQGPKKIAKADRSLWPYEINSATGFNYASKMEMLVFIHVLEGLNTKLNEDSLKTHLGVSKVDLSSALAWKKRTKNTLLTNFNALPEDKKIPVINNPVTWQHLSETSLHIEKKLPAELHQWFLNAKEFYSSYVYEQLRLAALFPRITSEILTLSNEEVTGFELPDKQFLLTFDDGPTAPGGHTDRLIETLNKNHTTGIFFILGDRLNSRAMSDPSQAIHRLYGNHLIASHGRVHKPHQRYDDWESSLSYTAGVIGSLETKNPKTKYFRPPYGQRNEQMVAYLKESHTTLMLWNIDSQDWNAKISHQEVADRVITLMLLWRRGIILFHDINPKANNALPIIWNKLGESGVKWLDPNTFSIAK
ncbi:polysaccharide deacetylase family protein [Fulvivirga kasyanovii]|uniref:Polysaccharide deacetylase family protein n=2 Tax=Fulvivirga kasyanovii TaxID=396812 RepID=A0ABW9RJG9_9BACT|nr:polysaccharide deacetylase family protein [Fulvivirga kasyanovii]